MLRYKLIRCDLCNKEIASCYRCRRCRLKFCGDHDDVTLYDCAGGNHVYSEECCNQCFEYIEHGKIVGSEYYCPECAPDDEVHGLEHEFKRQAWMCVNEVLREFKIAQHLSHSYLNDPKNWQAYKDDPVKAKLEWRELIKIQ